MGPKPKSPEVRFWSHVEKMEECWIWKGAKTKYGVGLFIPVGNRGLMSAYNFAYKALLGVLPKDFRLLRKCIEPACVNPDHYTKEKIPTVTERFQTYINVNLTTGCWEWTGNLNRGGYGVFQERWKVSIKAHVFSYTQIVGPVPEGLQIDHLCRNRKCCNPEHLEAVTQKENILRGVSFSAINSRKTHCTNGHEFTPENTQLKKTGRSCRECGRASAKKYSERRKKVLS